MLISDLKENVRNFTCKKSRFKKSQVPGGKKFSGQFFSGALLFVNHSFRSEIKPE